MKTSEDINQESESDTDESRCQARRDALKKLGLIAAWTPPAMLMLMRSKRASADSPKGPPGPP